MAARRYWRVFFGAITGIARFSEIEFRTSIGGADQATGGTAIASTGTAANAFDNNDTTDWASNNNDAACWIGYDFGVGVTPDLVEVVLRTSDTTLPGATILTGKVQSSNDNVSWDDESVTFRVNSWALSTTYSVFAYTLSEILARGVGGGVAMVTDAGLPTSISAKQTAQTAGMPIAQWEYDGASWVTVPTNGVIYGQVLEGASPVPFARVHCYFRPSGELIRAAICDASGNFTITGLDPRTPAQPDLGKYYVVALDPLGGVLYNALIYDRVVPQPA